MAERNLIKEGFLINTLAPGGSVSGTQTVSLPEMNAIVDEDLTSTALTVTGTFFTSLDADMGAKWKLNRVDLYTNESSSANFVMSVSEDGSDFFPLTMTGSTGLWSASVSGTTVSGAPRYIRYEHTPPSNRIVREWIAVNDDTLVDFGVDGSQTSVVIEDAPIGKPSDEITSLPIFNRFGKTAQGFVFIEDTGSKADNNIEVSLSASGPFFGRQTQSSLQPANLTWFEYDPSITSSYHSQPFSQGNGIFAGVSPNLTLSNLLLVSGTAYKQGWESLTDKKGWSAPGFTSSSVAFGQFLQGTISTSVTPGFALDNTFGNTIANSPDAVPEVSNGFIPFRAADYHTVDIELTCPALTPSDFVEGPRLFWRDHYTTVYSTEQSVLSSNSAANFTGSPQKFTFNLETVPTWSGVVRSLKIQPFTAASGLAITCQINSIEVYEGDKRERLALKSDTVISGTAVSLRAGGTVAASTFINVENVITEPCIITSVTVVGRPSTVVDNCGWALLRPANGFVYNDDAAAVNAFTNPFEVVEFVASNEHYLKNSSNTPQQMNEMVLWSALPGDFLAFTYRSVGGSGNTALVTRSLSLSNTTNGALISTSTTTIQDSESKSGLSASFNAINNWAFASPFVNVSVSFKSISAGKLLSNGTYTTPVFDGGSNPSLLSFDFEATANNSTSVDVSGASAFNTVNARASDIPPNTARRLGARTRQYFMGAHPDDTPSRFDPAYTSNYVIGLFNAEVQARETSTGFYSDDSIVNVGNQVLYNEDTQETWVLNLLISGTLQTDARPIWDVYDINTGQYTRTQHMTGPLTYFHSNSHRSGRENAFEPAGFLADYTREEIYIISRQDEFTVSNGTYNGIILNLDGSFKDVFWRQDQLLQDIVDGGFAGSTPIAEDRLTGMRTIAYRSGYFFALTNEDGEGNDYGTFIDIYRLGNNPSDPENLNDVEFITTIDIASVSGFSFVTEGRPVETITYCPANDLFYLLHVDSDSNQSTSDIHTMSITQVGTSPSETFVASLGPISNTASTLLSPDLVDSFTFGASSNGGSINNWEGAGDDQELKLHTSIAYNQDRDSFIHLGHMLSRRTFDLSREGEFAVDNFLFHKHIHSCLIEFAGNTLGVQVNTPAYPSTEDPLWGSASGTLTYEPIQDSSILFPTGRYAQLQYQLNADSQRMSSPYLEESRISQGIRVSDIPASSTKTIYLRTNIPEGETIGDQTGRLKVFWELTEI